MVTATNMVLVSFDSLKTKSSMGGVKYFKSVKALS